MRFSKKTGWPSGENPLTQAVNKKRSNPRFIDWTESNPTRCAFGYLDAGLLNPFSDPANLSYEPDPRGFLPAREAVCRYYAEHGASVRPERVFLTSSTSEAYGFLFRLLADTGDSIAAPAPSYPLFSYLADLEGLRLCHYRLRYDQDWRIDEASLRGFLKKEKPKALLCVNPNNPTGNYAGKNETGIFQEACASGETALIADEVFLDFGWSEKQTTFAGSKLPSFCLSGVSKILGLPQMKLSWITVNGPEDFMKEAARRLEIIADTYLSVHTASQRALPVWMEKRREISGEILEHVKKNRRSLELALASSKSVRVLGAAGGWYSVLEVQSDLDDEALALRLLEKQQLFVHPGYFFDFEEGNYLVVSLLLPEPLFADAVSRLTTDLR